MNVYYCKINHCFQQNTLIFLYKYISIAINDNILSSENKNQYCDFHSQVFFSMSPFYFHKIE